MYEIQWFKLDVNIFSNRKIKTILSLSDGDTYFRVWIQTIALAIECNNKGKLEFGENKPITIQDFSKILGKSNKKTEKILNKFLELGMLVLEGETFLIKNWGKYQSIDKFEKQQKQNRERQRRYRENKKNNAKENNVAITLSNTEEKNINNKENNKEKEREESENGFRKYKM